MSDFKQFCHKLGLSDKKSVKENLDVLKKAYHDTISQEPVVITGTDNKQYQEYLKLTKLYHHFQDHAENLDFEIDGMNLIQYAALKGYDHFLNAIEIPSNLLNSSLMNPLYIAAARGNFHCVEALIKAKAEVKLTEGESSVLHAAVTLPAIYDMAMEEGKRKIIQLLIEKYPKLIPLADDSGRNVAHVIGSTGHLSFLEAIYPLDSKIIACQDNDRKYPLHMAVLNNKLEIVRFLMNTDHPLELVDNEGMNALHYAAMYANKEMIEACCRTEYLNKGDNAQKTPFILAAEAGNVEALETLLRLGADPQLADSQGNTILNYGLSKPEVRKWIIANTSFTREMAETAKSASYGTTVYGRQ